MSSVSPGSDGDGEIPNPYVPVLFVLVALASLCSLCLLQHGEEGRVPSLELFSVLQCPLERGVCWSGFMDRDDKSLLDKEFSYFVVEGKDEEGC